VERNLPGKNLWSDVTGSSRDRRLPNFDTVAPGITDVVDQMNAGAEFQLNSTTVFRAGWVRSALHRTIEDQGALVNGDEAYFYGNPGEAPLDITPTSGATKPSRHRSPCASTRHGAQRHAPFFQTMAWQRELRV